MESLENQLLIAMPNLQDPYFHKTVTYICEHNDQGAMGLVINIPVRITLNELLLQIDGNKNDTSKLNQRVLAGGPVSPDRGFVLHNLQQGWESSLALNDEIMITTSKDILLSLGGDEAPQDFIVALGYAGWSSGQLEAEMQQNSWLNIPADKDILFNTPIELRWQRAAAKLGIDLGHLSSQVGHA
ncbi:YqgE/AlgH family protein [Thalassotalea aquiviva]|uniref:YqgE/AlgH family protein n=1 Tax=Thalassotalea aquiviva TaxID=3242415 RepID=UPI00352B7B79